MVPQVPWWGVRVVSECYAGRVASDGCVGRKVGAAPGRVTWGVDGRTKEKEACLRKDAQQEGRESSGTC
jgi:hypothetical protein